MEINQIDKKPRSLILTLEETLEQQEDLDSLCEDRSLQTEEIYWMNAVYGRDLVIKEYTGIAHNTSLKAVVPHGIYLTEDTIIEPDITGDLPVIFCHSRHEEKGYTKGVIKYGFQKAIFYSACPFLYVVELLKDYPKPEKKGTIFFLPHSTPQMQMETNLEALAEELSLLEEEYHPITICTFWSDFLLGSHLPFQKRGMKIVSAGHMYDPQFLFRFYHLCSQHRYACSSGLGSHIFYSIKSGCSYFHFNKQRYLYTTEDIVQKEYIDKWQEVENNSDIPALFPSPQALMTQEQMKVVDYYVGADYFKTPEELRYQLNLAEMLYNQDLRGEYQYSQYQLYAAQTELKQLEEEMEVIKEKLHNEKALREIIKTKLAETREKIAAMKTSKFWKLRTLWFKIKKIFG